MIPEQAAALLQDKFLDMFFRIRYLQPLKILRMEINGIHQNKVLQN